MESNSQEKLKIICFGDSLTGGYLSPTPEKPYFHTFPYGHCLRQWFGGRADIVVSGVNGELTGEMLKRFPRDVVRKSPDYVVILGGTNDLGASLAPSEILENLVSIFELAVQASIQPIGITIPSIRIEGDEDMGFIRALESRLTLNQTLTDYCTKAGFSCIDLYSETIEAGSEQLDSQYSNDGVHLSALGYERLARLLWDAVWADEYGDRSTETQ